MGEKVKDKNADAAQTPVDSELDEGLKDTFPASDPISPLQPGDGAEPRSEAGDAPRS